MTFLLAGDNSALRVLTVMFNVQKSCNLTNLTFKKTLQVPLVSLYSVVGPAASMFLRKSLLDLQKAVPIFFKRHPGQCFTIKTYVMVSSAKCKKTTSILLIEAKIFVLAHLGTWRNMDTLPYIQLQKKETRPLTSTFPECCVFF